MLKPFLAALSIGLAAAGIAIAGMGWLVSSYSKTMAEFDETAPAAGWWYESALAGALGGVMVLLAIGIAVELLGRRQPTRRG